MTDKYKISIIPQNLNRQETIVEIGEILQHLSDMTENLFLHLEKKLTNSQQHLGSITQRLFTVSKKINKLNGSKTAIQVFSSSKYPAASEVYRDYIPLFHDCPVIDLKKFQVKIKNVYTSHEPVDKLYFYHVNTVGDFKGKKLTGLGEMSTDITFVNNLHLYNSAKNLYKNFEIIESPRIVHSSIEYGDNLNELGDAPPSINERLKNAPFISQDYFYTPQIGEVPALDVPLDLPDLPGVADNLHFDTTIDSTVTTSSISSTSLTEKENTPTTSPSVTLISEKIDIHPVENFHLPPPPPPPPLPVEIIVQPQPQPHPVEITVKQNEKPKESTTENSINEEPKSTPLNTVLPMNSITSSLMEAIRNAGGAKKANLKSVAKSEQKTNQMKIVKGGDLMADLHNKLFMRRKGISGNKQQPPEGFGDNSALEKISAMIPPPEESKNNESTSNDEEWETS